MFYVLEHTLRKGGNVLVPCYPTGVLYDLLECLSGHLDSRGLASVRSDRNILTRKISILYDIVVVFF